ncbi:hypothetical protein SXCC_01018 [Gluconacetobacter sp. SXCC-1]|nr:hypothetical protein SXCC_01018 [Gluconacetobacter sp. SXCC-1]
MVPAGVASHGQVFGEAFFKKLRKNAAFLGKRRRPAIFVIFEIRSYSAGVTASSTGT